MIAAVAGALFFICGPGFGAGFSPFGFLKQVDTTPPPAIAGLSLSTGAAPGEVHVEIDFPPDVSDYHVVTVRRKDGLSAPNADCSSDGIVVKTYNAPVFPDPDAFDDTGIAGAFYGYRVCVYDEAGNFNPGGFSIGQARGPCGGTVVGGNCWYYGGVYESCTSVCATRGGYHTATATYAGQAGSTSNCSNVSTAFGHGLAGQGDCSGTPAYGSGGTQLGCCRSSTYGSGRCTGAATTASATGSNFNVRRYCACQY